MYLSLYTQYNLFVEMIGIKCKIRKKDSDTQSSRKMSHLTVTSFMEEKQTYFKSFEPVLFIHWNDQLI